MSEKKNIFNGLSQRTYDFFWDIAFQNEKTFYEANKERYLNDVKMPLFALAAELGDAAKDVDPAFSVEPAKVVSRIRRDTRFSKDKSPYRDHAWLGYKYHDDRIGQSFCMYAEFERTSYGYGMGMYCPEPALMTPIRNRILARPETFLKLIEDREFVSRFSVEGESYKRDRFPEAPEKLKTILNRKQLSFCYSSPDIEATMSPLFVDELKNAFSVMKPVYRFLMGLD